MNIIKKIYYKLLTFIGKTNLINYINGPEKLPEPLTKEEENNILKDYDVIAHTSKQNNSRWTMYEELGICCKSGNLKNSSKDKTSFKS